MTNNRRITAVLTALSFAVSLAQPLLALEPATISVSKIKDLNIRIYGYVETDVIADTTASYTEEEDSVAPQTRTAAGTSGTSNYAGKTHRTEMSVRNSRLGFEFNVPKTDFGLTTKGVIELDFLGNNATNTQPGSAPGAQTERDFFNNPAVRVRHAYLDLGYNDFDAKIGQYWSLLGWQPYYFPGETVILPSPGMLYRRFAQARGTYTLNMLDAWTLESAADFAKPAEMNSGSPETHAGLRLASTKYKAASISGSGTSMIGLSAAASGALIPIKTQSIGSPTGQVYAFDFAVPIIPSKDGTDRSNTLIWEGEFTGGNGMGGLEMAGLTFGVPGITAASVSPNGTPFVIDTPGNSIDSGIAGINLDGNAELIRARVFRTHLQYSLPGGKWAVSSGYSQAEARNLSHFGSNINAKSTLAWDALVPKIQFGYVSLFYDPLNWLRFAGEVNQTRATFNDINNRFAINNRFQFTTFFLF